MGGNPKATSFICMVTMLMWSAGIGPRPPLLKHRSPTTTLPHVHFLLLPCQRISILLAQPRSRDSGRPLCESVVVCVSGGVGLPRITARHRHKPIFQYCFWLGLYKLNFYTGHLHEGLIYSAKYRHIPLDLFFKTLIGFELSWKKIQLNFSFSSLFDCN